MCLCKGVFTSQSPNLTEMKSFGSWYGFISDLHNETNQEGEKNPLFNAAFTCPISCLWAHNYIYGMWAHWWISALLYMQNSLNTLLGTLILASLHILLNFSQNVENIPFRILSMFTWCCYQEFPLWKTSLWQSTGFISRDWEGYWGTCLWTCLWNQRFMFMRWRWCIIKSDVTIR